MLRQPELPAIDDVGAFRLYAYFASVEPQKNRFRFYALSWQGTLWGGAALIRSWGRIGTAGRSLTTQYPDREGARVAVERLVRLRLKRGYRLVAWE